MQVAQLMQPEPQYLLAGRTVEHAAKRMFVHDVAYLPVCRSDLRVVGMISAREIVKAVAQARAPELCAVEEVMVRDFPRCAGHEDAATVHARMVSESIDLLVVTDDAGRLGGVIERGRLTGVVGVRPTLSGRYRRAS